MAQDSKMVCLRPTVWAVEALSSKRVPARKCALAPALAPGSRIVSVRKPLATSAPSPSRAFFSTMGPSVPTLAPGAMRVRSPSNLVPGYKILPG